uniref:Uncharacterized protein n=1 Tax=Romanomermis culicivorax TaxID=13658 RepID=A0A915IBS9_ROMCU
MMDFDHKSGGGNVRSVLDRSHKKYRKARFGAAISAIQLRSRRLGVSQFGTGRHGASYFSSGHFGASFFGAKLFFF